MADCHACGATTNTNCAPGFSLFTLQVTHHIGPDVDAERERISALILAGGGSVTGVLPSGIPGNRWHRNGGGDRFRTDGAMRVLALGQC
ncbi:LssY C-terminal domain-containing protein [Novosphingobium sp.]|uniref:LssY C-terminal domain-containing protein n=1 Tax=Novosphingobium sp. TaxID=1874826 RepID=UPI003B527E24